MTARHLLLIEDNAEVQLIVKDLFERDFKVHIAKTLESADKLLKACAMDIVLLDVVLPDGDGFKYLSRLKNSREHADLSVILLTGQKSSDDKIHGFTLGAEDYVTKPFDGRELKMRVAARLKSGNLNSKNSNLLTCGNLFLDSETQKVHYIENDQNYPIDVSPLEFKILRFLIKNKNAVLSRQQLLDSVWGNHIHILDRTIDAHVSRLRKKIEASDCTIKTVYGNGYSFQTKEKKQQQAA